MKPRNFSLIVPEVIGTVSAEYIVPVKSSCMITLAHGAGAGMNHPFLTELAKLLAEQHIGTLRFNFPFMEHKKGRPDTPAIAHKTIEAAINNAHETYPALPLFASGKSFGGRMSSQYLSAQPHPEVKGIIFYGFPLHAPGKPSTERAEHLKEMKVPMLFLQGTRDEFATLSLIENVCASLPLATLIKIEGANHAFKAGKQNILPMLATLTNDWVEGLMFLK
ncbi:MAG: alpha/beta family hydrolase [Ginsengibacter sp.]